jgi:hypothetical protein
MYADDMTPKSATEQRPIAQYLDELSAEISLFEDVLNRLFTRLDSVSVNQQYIQAGAITAESINTEKPALSEVAERLKAMKDYVVRLNRDVQNATQRLEV